jgi:hypothetical protein
VKLLAFLILVFLGLQAEAASKYTSADLYFTVSADGKSVYDDPRHFALKSARQLSQLAAFFDVKEADKSSHLPKGTHRSKSPSWGWVCFHRKGAKDVTFAFNLDGKLATGMNEDEYWRPKPGLRAFLLRFWKK